LPSTTPAPSFVQSATPPLATPKESHVVVVAAESIVVSSADKTSSTTPMGSAANGVESAGRAGGGKWSVGVIISGIAVASVAAAIAVVANRKRLAATAAAADVL
jgi:hypothetical protein